jgi:hypothetical protein
VTPDAAAAQPGPEWLRARRTGAAERFATTTLPTDAEEVWRYSRIAELDLDDFSPRAGSGSGLDAVAVPANVQQTIDATGPWSGVAVGIDGQLVSTTIWRGGASSYVRPATETRLSSAEWRPSAWTRSRS